MELKYRNALKTDVDYLLWLRKETMDQHIINSGILLNDEEQLLRVNYLFEQAKIIISDDQNIGLLKIDDTEDNVEIVQIQIDPKFQGKGIGRDIIQTVIDESLRNKKTISLSVLKENPAKELYLRIGFKIIDEDDTSFIMKYHSQTSA